MRHILVVIGVGACLLGFARPGLAQQGAKAMYHTGGTASQDGSGRLASPPSVPTTTPAKNEPAEASKRGSLGIMYWCELVDRDGKRTEVIPANHVFQSGDRIKLRVQTNRDGYLYLVNIGPTKNHNLLFPHPMLTGGSNVVQAGKIYDLPYGALIKFDDKPGDETLRIILSQRPMTWLSPGGANTEAMSPPDSQKLVAAAQKGAKDLEVEVDPGPVPRTYAAIPIASLGPEDVATLEVTLRRGPASRR